MKKLILLFVVASTHLSLAQINNVWIFGSHSQVDFSSGTADTSYNNVIDNFEGTASVCDYNGNLLFYATGDKCYDKNGIQMPNGSGLGGSYSSTTVAILQKPGDCTKYYLFTTQDHTGSGQLYYSIIDMCLNSGKGDVVIGMKKILLESGCSEKIALVPNSNQMDVWLITHKLSNNNYVVYDITASGISATSQTYSVGSIFQWNDNSGYLKANKSGTQLAVAVLWGNICEVVNFNPATGIVSGNATNYGTIITSDLNGDWYGLEFSPNGQYLYAARCQFGAPASLYQINLIDNSYTLLSTESGPVDYYYGALELGPDGKIYMAKNTSPYLGVINDPDSSGLDCNYVNDGLLLAANSYSEFGLPTRTIPVPQGSNNAIISLGNDTSTCNPLTIDLVTQCDESFLWQDGSTLSSYTISSAGTYFVTASSPACGISSDTIQVTSGVSATITGNDTICIGDSTVLTASAGDSYLWSTGSTSQSIVVSPSSTTEYSVIVSDSGCSSLTVISVVVILPSKVFFSIAEDTVCLDGPSIILSSGSPAGGIYSGDGVVGNTFFPNLAGIGTHEISYTYTDVCATVSIQHEITVVVCTGIENIISRPALSVFPNPVKDEFTIQFSGPVDCSEIIMTDELGRNVTLKNVSRVNDHEFHFSAGSLAAGVYWIILKNESSISRVKIVKI